jgi:hypothetical protein
MPAWARLTFKIDSAGVPFDVAVIKSSEVCPLDKVSMRALVGYRFKTSTTDGREHALMFSLGPKGTGPIQP